MIYFQVKDNKGKILASNMHEFSRMVNLENNKNFSENKKGEGLKSAYENMGGVGVWIVVENERDLLKSTKLFNKTFEIYKTIALGVYGQYVKDINAYAHILTTIQGQIRQKIDDFSKDNYFYGESYSDSVNNILKIVEKDKRSVANLICYIQKRIIDMRAHLLGTEIIHFGEQYEIKPVIVSLKRAILNQCTPFLEELEENMVKIKFFFGDECEIEVDKNMFSLIMYNFFSNAVKYAKPNSEIRLNYSNDLKNLDISMISLKMEKNEIKNLFNEGIRGIHAKNISGKGIGLFVIQKSLKLMNKEQMYIEPNYQKHFSENSFIYNENHFKFSL